MSNDAGGGAPKKLTTQDILAQARARAAAAKGEAAAEAAAPAEAPAAEKPAGKPGSTKDILAAARAAAAAKAGGATPTEAAPAPEASTPAAPAAAGAKPKSTADILAAARAAKAGGTGAAPAGDKPKSTADILAAARANSGAAAASAASPKEKPAAKAPAKGAVAADSGNKPSVQEMLAAVRGQAAAAPVAKAAVEKKPVVAPPMPAKPAGKASPDAGIDRRSLLLTTVFSPFALAWTAFTGATLAATLGCVRFMLPNVLTEPPSKFKVGPAGDFDLGTVSEKFKASNGIWLVHTDKYHGRNLIYALSTVCTHLGCTPSWLEGEQKFKCPCHGSGFYINGINFEGPAPRPLERVGIRIAEDGMLEVDKSLKFQEEMGQWADPASYVEVA
jgi:cytochrome b6-f complex iron-sulfur subunit